MPYGNKRSHILKCTSIQQKVIQIPQVKAEGLIKSV